jgi:hypothetical protein
LALVTRWLSHHIVWFPFIPTSKLVVLQRIPTRIMNHVTAHIDSLTTSLDTHIPKLFTLASMRIVLQCFVFPALRLLAWICVGRLSSFSRFSRFSSAVVGVVSFATAVLSTLRTVVLCGAVLHMLYVIGESESQSFCEWKPKPLVAQLIQTSAGICLVTIVSSLYALPSVLALATLLAIRDTSSVFPCVTIPFSRLMKNSTNIMALVALATHASICRDGRVDAAVLSACALVVTTSIMCTASFVDYFLRSRLALAWFLWCTGLSRSQGAPSRKCLRQQHVGARSAASEPVSH